LRALKLDSFINQRRESAAYWTEKLSDYEDELILPIEPEHAKHVYFGYPITCEIGAGFTRKELVDHLEMELIETRPIMAGNMAEQPGMRHIDHRTVGELPNSNSRMIMRQSFFFGNHTRIGPEEREYIADSINNFLKMASNE